MSFLLRQFLVRQIISCAVFFTASTCLFAPPKQTYATGSSRKSKTLITGNLLTVEDYRKAALQKIVPLLKSPSFADSRRAFDETNALHSGFDLIYGKDRSKEAKEVNGLLVYLQILSMHHMTVERLFNGKMDFGDVEGLEKTYAAVLKRDLVFTKEQKDFIPYLQDVGKQYLLWQMISSAHNVSDQISALIKKGRSITEIQAVVEDKKCNPFAVYKSGNTLLHEALLQNNVQEDVVFWLLGQGSSCAVKNNDGMTPLHIACKKGLLSIVKGMLAKKATAVKGVYAHPDVEFKDPDESLEKLSNVELEDYRESRELLGYAKYLFEDQFVYDLDLESVNEKRETAFFLACQSGNQQLVRFLIGSKLFDTTCANSEGATVLHDAVARNDPEMFKLLYASNVCNYAAVDSDKRTVLHYLARNFSPKILSFLVDKKPNFSDIDLCDMRGAYALDHFVLHYYNMSQVKKKLDPDDRYVLQNFCRYLKAFNRLGITNANANFLTDEIRAWIDTKKIEGCCRDNGKDMQKLFPGLERYFQTKEPEDLMNFLINYKGDYQALKKIVFIEPSFGGHSIKKLLAKAIDLYGCDVGKKMVTFLKDHEIFDAEESCCEKIINNKEKACIERIPVYPVEYCLIVSEPMQPLLCMLACRCKIDRAQRSEGSLAHQAIENNLDSQIIMLFILYSDSTYLNLGDEQHGRTALHVAVIKKNYQALALLLDKKDINVDKTDRLGKTALHYACQQCDPEAVRILLKRGALMAVHDGAKCLPLDCLLRAQQTCNKMDSGCKDNILEDCKKIVRLFQGAAYERYGLKYTELMQKYTSDV